MRNKSFRIQSLVLFVFISLAGLFGYILLVPEFFGFWGLCEGTYVQQGARECFSEFGTSIGKPLYFASLYIAPVFLLLMFLPQTYHSWKKFGLWALPLIIILVILTPVTGEAFSPVPSRGLAALRLAQGFLIISVLIIAYSWWKEKQSS